MAQRVARCFLRRGGTVFLYRADELWTVPSAEVAGDPAGTARRLVREWTPSGGDWTLVRAGDPVHAGARVVHPFLFDCETPIAATEGIETAWAHASEIHRLETTDGLWCAYSAVAPTVESVRDDRTHGSAYLSIRALEVLRDRASAGESRSALVEHATDLLDARPSMAVLENRVNRAMHGAGETASADAVEAAAREGIDRAIDADERASERAAERLHGTVLTLSRSGTVREALLSAVPDRVIVLESRPEKEGGEVAAGLAGGTDVTLTLDAAVAHVMREVDCVLVGSDTVLGDGSVVNKVGTRTAAVAAAREGVPVYVVAAADKITSAVEPALESVGRGALDAGEGVAVECPLFDRTPADLVALITEDGETDANAIESRATDHERLARWKETTPAEDARDGRQ